jgi:hypothetical protein
MKTLLHWFIFVLLAANLAWALEPGTALKLPESGCNLARTGGGWINVEATENRLVVKFFDSDKKTMPPDAVRATARVVYPARKDRRVVLNPDGDTLVSPPSILPPLVFRIHLSLFATDGAEAESFVVQYPGGSAINTNQQVPAELETN